MILQASQRGGGMQLAVHLLKPENEHVELHEISGFVAEDLAGAFKEVHAISRGTRCKQFLFSLSLNPPGTEDVPVEVFEDVIARVEKKMGLAGQPRAIVFHEKQGRRHAHCVWSRIDAVKMRAINLPHFKLKLTELSRQIYREQGWEVPRGFEDHKERDPLNYSQGEAQQAKRVKRDTRALKAMFQRCWAGSDDATSFAHSLREEGYVLARGERRGFVALDGTGEVYSLSRWCGVKTNELRARLGDLETLPDIEQATALLACDPGVEVETGVAASEAKPQTTAPSQDERHHACFEAKRLALVADQWQERDALRRSQTVLLDGEIKSRAQSLPTGLSAAWAKLTGAYQRLCAKNEAQVGEAVIRDRRERQDLIQRHLSARRALQAEFYQGEAQRDLARAGPQAVNPLYPGLKQREHNAPPQSGPLHPVYDPAQPLIIPADEDRRSIAAKVARDPAHILEVIADKQEVFSRTDVLRALVAYMPDPAKLRLGVDVALRSPDLVKVGAFLGSNEGAEPRYSLEGFLSVKATVSAQARTMASTPTQAVARKHIDAAIAKESAALQRSVGAELSEEQKGAIRHVLTSGQLSCVIGLAGTGKSTMLSAARYGWEAQGLRVIGAALSGKAAEGLQRASGIESRTLASLEHGWKNGYGVLTRSDVLVIDEAGMVGTRQLARFVEAVKQSGARIVLVGDPEQLQPIQAGTPFKEIARDVGAARLSEIHRQKQAWQRQASRDLSEGRGGEAIDAYRQQGCVTRAMDTPEAIARLAQDYVRDMEHSDRGPSRLALTHKRQDVHAINQAIRSLRKAQGELCVETLLLSEHGPRAFASGDRIVFTRNDRDLGVKNGSFGTVVKLGDGYVNVCLDAEQGEAPTPLTFAPDQYADFDHGYATTIHKSQGATVDKAYVLGSNTMDRHLSYVALTRHRAEMRLYAEPAALRRMEKTQDKSGEKPRGRYERPQKRQAAFDIPARARRRVPSRAGPRR